MKRLSLSVVACLALATGCGRFEHRTTSIGPTPSTPSPIPTPGPSNPDYTVTVGSYNGYANRLIPRSHFMRMSNNAYRALDAIHIDATAGVQNRIWVRVPADSDLGSRVRMRVQVGCRSPGMDSVYTRDLGLSQPQEERRFSGRVYSANLVNLTPHAYGCAPYDVALRIELIPYLSSEEPVSFEVFLQHIPLEPRPQQQTTPGEGQPQ